jgi:hypothetical protein
MLLDNYLKRYMKLISPHYCVSIIRRNIAIAFSIVFQSENKTSFSREYICSIRELDTFLEPEIAAVLTSI